MLPVDPTEVSPFSFVAFVMVTLYVLQVWGFFPTSFLKRRHYDYASYLSNGDINLDYRNRKHPS